MSGANCSDPERLDGRLEQVGLQHVEVACRPQDLGQPAHLVLDRLEALAADRGAEILNAERSRRNAMRHWCTLPYAGPARAGKMQRFADGECPGHSAKESSDAATNVARLVAPTKLRIRSGIRVRKSPELHGRLAGTSGGVGVERV